MISTIYLDWDTTLNNLGKIWLEELNKIHKTNHTYKDINNWDWFYQNFEKDVVNEALKSIYFKTDLNEGALNFYQECKKLAKVKILTATHTEKNNLYGKKDAFIRNLLCDDNVEIIHETKKEIYANNESILIDDKPNNVLQFVENNGHSILYETPYNITLQHEKIRHSNDYGHILYYIKIIFKENIKECDIVYILKNNSYNFTKYHEKYYLKRTIRKIYKNKILFTNGESIKMHEPLFFNKVDESKQKAKDLRHIKIKSSLITIINKYILKDEEISEIKIPELKKIEMLLRNIKKEK